MKKLFFLLLAIPLVSFGQDNIYSGTSEGVLNDLESSVYPLH